MSAALTHQAGLAATHALHFLQGEPLLELALAAMALVVVGGMIRRPLPLVSGFMRFFGNIGLIGTLLLAVLEVVQYGGGADLGAIPGLGPLSQRLGMPGQTVTGGETRIPMGGDGHFWVRAQINGASRRFLVDTGATLTTLPPAVAQEAGLEPERGGQAVALNTANGTATGELTTIATLRVGNVVARHLEAVVAPGLGDTCVLGMNFLSRLASWRVEGRTLILVPHHPQADASRNRPEE